MAPGTNFFYKLVGATDVALTDASGKAVLAKCTGAIPTTANAFQKGCIMLKTDAATATVGLYTNSGTLAAPVWSSIKVDLAVLSNTPQTLTGAGAVNLTTKSTLIVTTGANALTLADGVEGQEKFLVMKTDGGTGTLTPANLYNGTTLTFDDVGDSAHLIFTDGQWTFVGGTATLA